MLYSGHFLTAGDVKVGEEQLIGTYDHHDMKLVDFLRILWKQKFLIGFTIALCVLSGIIYILCAKPLYEAVIYIAPPSQGDIAVLNVGRSKEKNSPLVPYQLDEVYNYFTQELQAESTKRFFFNDVFLPAWKNENKSVNEGELYNLFTKSLTVKEINAGPFAKDNLLSKYVVGIKGHSPTQDAEWLKKYIAIANQKAIELVLNDFVRQKNAVVHELTHKIDYIREVANTQRLDRIQQLHEAIKVAQAVGAKKEITTSNKIIADASAVNNPSMMYLRGSAALQAELNNLQNRESSDAFAPGELQLRETQTKLDFYKNISANADRIELFKLDGEIRAPELPIAPRKKIILLLSLLGGLLLGIALGLTRNVLSIIVK